MKKIDPVEVSILVPVISLILLCVWSWICVDGWQRSESEMLVHSEVSYKVVLDTDSSTR